MSELDKKPGTGIDKAQASAAEITNLSESSFFKQLLGFWVTFKAQFKKPTTIQYPDVPAQIDPRFQIGRAHV